MKVHSLEKKQFIPLKREEVFSFFQDPENLAKITPPSLGFRILTPSPVPMHAGSVIDYTIRLAGLPVRWTTVISEYAPPHRFADVQVRGPYSFWHHTHVFEEAEGGTLMTDRIRYALAGGPLGGLANRLLVSRQLASIFGYRQKVIEELLVEGAPASREGGRA